MWVFITYWGHALLNASGGITHPQVNTLIQAEKRNKLIKRGVTCRVPDWDVVRPPLFEVKRPSDGADGVFELSLHVSVEQRRLPHVHVAQQNDLHVGLLHLRRVEHVWRAPPVPLFVCLFKGEEGTRCSSKRSFQTSQEPNVMFMKKQLLLQDVTVCFWLFLQSEVWTWTLKSQRRKTGSQRGTELRVKFSPDLWLTGSSNKFEAWWEFRFVKATTSLFKVCNLDQNYKIVFEIPKVWSCAFPKECPT